jgi:hypothetical protein
MGGMPGMGGMGGMPGMGGMGGMPGMGGMGGMPGGMDFEKVRTSSSPLLELWHLFEWQMMADMKNSGEFDDNGGDDDGDAEAQAQAQAPESDSDTDNAAPPPLEST